MVCNICKICLGIVASLIVSVSMSHGQNAQPESESSVRTVTVQAPRPDWEALLSPGAVTIVEPDRFKGEQKNLAELLDRVPGLFVHRVTGAGQYTTISIRGSTAAQVNVYVDGILQNLGNDPAVDISLIPVSQVARVEVYRGYVPVRFAGSPLGGVVNVVTRKADRLGLSVEAGIASLGGQRYNLTATMPTFWGGSLLVGAHHDRSDGNFRFKQGDVSNSWYLPIREPAVFWRKHNDNSNSDFLIKWQNDHFSLKAGYKETDRSLPEPAHYDQYQRVFGRILVSEYYKRQNVKQNDLVAGYRNTIGKLDFGLQLYYLRQKKRIQAYNYLCDDQQSFPRLCYGFPEWPGTRWDNRNTVKNGGQIDVSYKLGDHNLVEFYADYSEEHLSVSANKWVLPSAGTDTPPYIDVSKRYWPEYVEKRYHVQIQDTINFGDNDSTKLTLSYKLDKVESTGNDLGDESWRPSWGIALVHNADENVSLRMTYGTFVRYPNFAERFGDGLYVMPTYAGANKNFAATWETGEQWDIGVDWHGEFFGAGGRASLSYFNRHTENMSAMYINRNGAYFANAGHATVDGFEFETYLSWPRFDLDFSATWQRGRMNYVHVFQGYSETGMENMITNRPAWQYHVRGNYRLPGDILSIFAEYHYIDRLSKGYVTEVGDAVNGLDKGWVFDEPLATINAGMSWQINDNLALTAGINDILNKSVMQGQYLDSDAHETFPVMGIVDYPGAGRTYFATVRYEFGGQNSSDVPADHASLLVDKSIQKDRSFYVASKVVYSKMHTALSGENVTFGGGRDGTSYSYGWPYWWFRPEASFTEPVYGGNNSQSGMAAGLAVGIDFYKHFNVPLRLEIEGNLHTRVNLEYGENYFNTLPADQALSHFEGKQNLQATLSTIFLNVYLDFHNRTRFTPYVGAGLGALRYHFKLTQDVDFTYGQDGWYDKQFNITTDFGLKTRFFQKSKGWDLIWNLSAGFAYQITPATHIDLSYRYANFGEHRIDVAIPSVIVQKYGGYSGQGFIKAYGSGTGQTIKMEVHQAVLAFRFDLGAGQETVAEFDRKKATDLKLFGGLSGPGLLERPAIRAGSFSISPRIGLYLPDKKFGLEDGYVAGLSLGYNVTGNWGVEATVDMSNHMSETSGNAYSGVARVGSARLNAVYHIVDPDNELSRWVPYATAGIGMVWSMGHFSSNVVVGYGNSVPVFIDRPTGDYSSIAVNAGLGMKYFLNQNVALRVEAVDTFAFRDADFQRDVGPYHNLAVTGGLTFQFGGVQ